MSGKQASSVDVNVGTCHSDPHSPRSTNPAEQTQERNQRLASFTQQSGNSNVNDRLLSGSSASYKHTAVMAAQLATLGPNLPRS
ncbi:hypothetical protein M426DRAFT_17836 [Hypoxylon sp. CI-4A]|nr:hypothetical protein M426DRAFT_17836 [Hypoxylon sp. CI-4A]